MLQLDMSAVCHVKMLSNIVYAIYCLSNFWNFFSLISKNKLQHPGEGAKTDASH